MTCHVVLHKLEEMDLDNHSVPGNNSPVKSVHVEICQNSSSTAHRQDIERCVTNLLKRDRVSYEEVHLTEFVDPFLTEHVKRISIYVSELDVSSEQAIELSHAKLHLHTYQLSSLNAALEEIEDEDMAAASHWLLPSADFDGVWDSLVFDGAIKSQLLHYASTTLLFSDCKVDPNIISWNRVVLLHGPPGTGKTSLCKALAQKLCIRLSDRYSYGQLIEINSHSLFSKWFSESGKLVMKMFQKITEFVDDQDCLVCVLIDEVESLTAARKSSLNGTEPSDAIRVVNALLTQIDQMKRYPNVLILTTSNITEAIDLAFVDRADIKQYIGPPSAAACFRIYHSCVNELMRAKIIAPSQCLLVLRALEAVRFQENDATKLSLKLKEIACTSEGLSGRTLRKLPFLAHALFVKSTPVTLENYLEALEKAVAKQYEEREQIKGT